MGTFLIQTNRDFLFTHFVKSIISNNLWLYNYFFIDIDVLNISISQHYICTCSELPIVNLFVLMLPSSNAHLFNVQLCFMVYIHCKNLQLILVKNLSIYMYTFHYYICFILVPSNLVVYIGVLCVKSLFCL